MQRKNHAICYSCCKQVEYTECSGSGVPPEETRCNVLSGWLSVTQWQGHESAIQYYFCSLLCLYNWVESQIPTIPDVFIKGFEEE